jgi:hypothetical protein
VQIPQDPLGDVDVDRGVDQQRRAHLHRPRTGQQELDRVLGRRYASDAHHRDVRERPRYLVHGRERQRLDRGAREPTDRRGRPRPQAMRVDGQCRDLIDQGETEGAGPDTRLGGLDEPRQQGR